MSRILVIEDNDANLELMKYLLEVFGHEVVIARDGETGLALALKGDADLIVCDVHLPKMDGVAIARRLKADPERRGAPLIAVTALAMVGDRERLLAAGFDGYIAKPIEPEAFARQIGALLPVGAGAQPVAMSPPVAGAADEAQGAAPYSARVLVVDDSTVNGELMRATLEPFGYQLELVSGVSQALERMRSTHFDLVLSDVHMPGQTGHALLRAAKADPALRGVPIMLLTSSAWSAAERDAALDQGAASYLVRPMPPTALLRAVEASLRAAVGTAPEPAQARDPRAGADADE
ncbi:MAG: response regulator [Gammaproteobacteria bacterium]